METTRKNTKHPLTAARYLRQFRGLSMTELADKLGLPFLTVSNFEHGRDIKLDTLRRFASFFGVSLDCLARGDMTAAAAQLSSPAIRSSRVRTFLGERQRRCDLVGDLGERIVIQHERKRLAGTPYALAVNGNASEELTAGFDILSFAKTGVPIYIEVKTTVLGKDEPFYISSNELDFARRCKEHGLLYQLHRVYRLDEASGACSVAVYSADELLRGFDFAAVSYKARRVTA